MVSNTRSQRIACVFIVFACVSLLTSPATRAKSEHRQVKLTEEHVYGGEDAPEDHVIFGGGNFVVDRHGNVLVSDSKMHHIKLYNVSGTEVTSIGSEGSGPGDLRRPGALILETAGHIVIHEMSNRRVQRITRDGGFVTEAPFPDVIWQFAIGPNREIYAMAWVVPTGSGRNELSTMRIVRLNDDLTTAHTLHEFTARTTIIAETQNGMTVWSAPYPPYLKWCVLPDGSVVVGHTDTNKLEVLSPAGDVIRTLVLGGEPHPLTQKDKDAYLSKSIIDGKDMMKPAIRKLLKFPKFRPRFVGLSVNADSGLMVRHHALEDEDVRFDTLDEQGNRTGSFSTGPLPYSIQIHGGKLYALYNSWGELPRIIRYRME